LVADPKGVSDISDFSTISIVSQPAKFQVANYNIHPPPSLSIDTPSSSSHTVYMSLVEISTKRIVQGGFQTGDVRVLRSGQQTLYFTGLKLSKMGPIKEELHIQNTRQLTSDFCIQFKIGTRVFYSSTFKLVSSCSQLPKEIRDFVRPPKKSGMRRSRSNPDHPSSEEGSPSGSPQHSFPFLPSQEIENQNNNNNNTDPMSNTPTKQIPPIEATTQSTTEIPTSTTETTGGECKTTDELRVLRQELEVAIQRGEADSASQFAFKLANFNKRRKTDQD
jgi:hypothetical protein